MKDIIINEKDRKDITITPEELLKHKIAYINSGGQIQKCPPCTYGERVELTSKQKRKVNSLFEKKWDRSGE
tara:strand:- start:125 stop:337 length:213 start_codon:yes stop_codon:yes gene_type:complete